MQKVELFKMEKLVGIGVIVNFIKGGKMRNGFNAPSKIKIELI